MRVVFHGAASEVTGSLHEVEAAGKRLLMDCGKRGQVHFERSEPDPDLAA